MFDLIKESQKNIQTQEILTKINQEKAEYFAKHSNTNQVKTEQEFTKKQKNKLEKELKIAIEKYEFEKASALKDILETF